MTINSLKDLQKVIALCRKQGVTTIKIDGIELTLGSLPKTKPRIDVEAFPEANIRVPQYSPVIVDEAATSPITADIDTPDELSEEQLMFYSSRPEESRQ